MAGADDSLPSTDLQLHAGRLLPTSRKAARLGPQAGEVFGSFRILEELGRGGMGVVLLAEQDEPRRRVALKVLGVRLASDPDALERFRREIHAVGSLQHENIVRVLTAGEAEGSPYFAMEYVPGRPLSEVLARGALEPRRAARLALQAARGLAYAHGRGILHRDLKPSNFLLTRDDRLLLLDFGLARSAWNPSLTRDDQIVGTPKYMAPEQLFGRPEDVDARADVFGLGATLHEMLTGRPMVEGNAFDARRRVEPSPRARAIRPAIPRDLDEIVAAMVAPVPDSRYPTAQAAADDLDRFLAGLPVSARPASAGYRLRRFVGRHRAATAVGALGAVLLATSAVGFTLALDARRREAEAARAEAEARALVAEELLAELSERRQRDEVTARSLRLLESSRPALEAARRALYDREAPARDLARLATRAREPIEQALALSPDLALGHHLLGQAWQLSGEDARAEAAWREALRLQPDLAPARFELGRHLLVRSFLESLASGDDEERAPSRAEGLRLAGEGLRELDLALAAGSSGVATELHRQLALALRAFLGRDEAEVRRIARESLHRFPGVEGVEEFQWLLGLVSSGDERLAAYDRALEKKPRFALALFCRGAERGRRGDFPAAIADYDVVLELQPRWILARLNRGIARRKTGDPVGAIADYDVVLEVDPRHALGHYLRGNARKMKGDLDGAIRDYDAALEIEPSMAEALVNRANTRRLGGDPSGAIADYERALAVAPADWRYRAQVASRLEEWRRE